MFILLVVHVHVHVGGEETNKPENMETNEETLKTTDNGSEVPLNKEEESVTQSESSGESSSASDSDDRLIMSCYCLLLFVIVRSPVVQLVMKERVMKERVMRQ